MGDKCPDENRNWIGFVTDWAHDIDSFLTAIWAEIGDFATPRCGYAGLATLATQSDTGPQMRNLVIRDANRRDGLVHLHTDRQTPKVTEIDANSAASLLIWRPETQLQIRLGGRAEVLGAYAARQIWADVPFASRGNYGVTPAPGSAIETSGAYKRLPDESRLAVLQFHVDHIDAVHLGKPLHIRARYDKARGWQGQWVAP